MSSHNIYLFASKNKGSSENTVSLD